MHGVSQHGETMERSERGKTCIIRLHKGHGHPPYLLIAWCDGELFSWGGGGEAVCASYLTNYLFCGAAAGLPSSPLRLTSLDRAESWSVWLAG